MSTNRAELWRKNRENLVKAAEENGIDIKGKGRLLDRLKQRSTEQVNQMIKYMEEDGYTLDMIGELYSKEWAKQTRKSGGKQGVFKTESQKRFFEKKWTDRALKEYEKNLKSGKGKKAPKPTQQEKRRVRNMPFKQAMNKIKRNQVFDLNFRKEEYSRFVQKLKRNEPLTKKEQKWLERARQYNREMQVITVEFDRKTKKFKTWYLNESANNGFAVLYHIIVTGASKRKAMQLMVYDRIESENEKYTTPTEIPNGISVTGGALNRINDQRLLIGLPPITKGWKV